MVGDDDGALREARERVEAELGPAALVDAVAVASNFERMVRIADGSGIPLDAPLNAMTESLREDLDLNRFAARANTPVLGPLARFGGRLLGAALPRIARVGLAVRDRRRS